MAKKETEKEEKKVAEEATEKKAKKAPKEEKKSPKKAPKEDKKAPKDGKKKKKKEKPQELPDDVLPQNIIAVGKRVEENKNIYIAQDVYRKIHKFTKNKLTNEAGGILVGHTIEELGKTNIMITGFIEAKHSEGTPTTLTFTHETWEYIHAEVAKKYPGKKILGWIHTHPDFGIFLSDYDKFIHENFFNDENQIAYVVDPIQKIEGLYFWIDGKLTKCAGFFIYDRTGEKIEVAEEKEEEVTETKEKAFSFKNVMIAILTAAVIFLTFSHFSISNEIKTVKEQQNTLVTEVNTVLGNLSAVIGDLQNRVAELEAQLNPTEPETTEPTGTEPTGTTEESTEPTGTTGATS